MPAGPERGKAWGELDSEALIRWASDRDEDIRYSARTELARRGEAASPDPVAPAQANLFG